MKKINRPKETVADILTILKSEATQHNVKQDIDSTLAVLTNRESIYLQKIADNTAFEIPREQNISPRVGKKAMISYYDYRLVVKEKGRAFYDKIIISTPNNTCPYCGVRTVKTIDHFLPKTEYPSYSITPVNLVPSCRDCNTGKMVSYPTSSADQTFHPYFDNVEGDCWMKAELHQTDPLSFQYQVIKPVGWNNNQYERAKSHFSGYKINELFSNEANRELRGMQKNMKDLYSKDMNLLKDHLTQTLNSCKEGLGINDWKTLMYIELSSNEWFLNGCNGTTFFN